MDPIQLNLDPQPSDTPLPPLDPSRSKEARAQLIPLTIGYQVSSSLQTVCSLDIPTVLGLVGRPLSAAEIAVEVAARAPEGVSLSIDVATLEPMLRILSQFDVFTEHPGPVPAFGLSDLSQLLRSDTQGTSQRSEVLFTTRPDLCAMYREVPRAVAHGTAGSTAYEVANGTTVWEFIRSRPVWGGHFNTFMSSMTASDASLVTTWGGWSEMPPGTTVVDVGGNVGALAGALKRSHPDLEVINFDQEATIARAPMVPGVAHVAGDFFLPGSVPKCDVAIMKHVLHDWSDEECARILANVAGSLPPGGRLLILDSVMPPAGERAPGRAVEFARSLSMRLFFGAKERTFAEFALLVGPCGFTMPPAPAGQVDLGIQLLECVLG